MWFCVFFSLRHDSHIFYCIRFMARVRVQDDNLWDTYVGLGCEGERYIPYEYPILCVPISGVYSTTAGHVRRRSHDGKHTPVFRIVSPPPDTQQVVVATTNSICESPVETLGRTLLKYWNIIGYRSSRTLCKLVRHFAFT